MLPGADTSLIRPRRFSPADWCLLSVVAAFIVSGLAAVTDVNIYTPDSTRYLAWAQSLASLRGYSDLTGPESHRYVVNAPFYPFLLAPAAVFFPMNVIAAKIVTLAWGTAALVLCFQWASVTGGKASGVVACLLIAANPLFFTYSTEVLSEAPFAAVLFGILLLVPVIRNSNASSWKLALLVTLLSAAVLLREIGISLVLASSLYLLLTGRRNEGLFVALIPLLVYLLWLVRNEIIVGGVEQPALTNAKLFTHHFFTNPGSSLAEEYQARISMNMKKYADLAGGLLLFPTYTGGITGLIAPNDQASELITRLLAAGRYVLIAATVLGAFFGAVAAFRKRSDLLLTLLFLIFYLSIILVYPISDVRFLCPLMLIAAAYTGIGVLELSRRFRPTSLQWRGIQSAGIVALATICLVPNVVWISQSINSAARYRALEGEGFKDAQVAIGFPQRYLIPLRLAGQWLEEKTPPGSVILTRLADLSEFLHDRKVLSMSDRGSVDGIEGLIRDYSIPYVVTVDDGSGLWTLELQMRESEKYNFVLVSRIGNLGIFRVDPAIESPGTVRGCDDTPIRRALILLAHGKPASFGSPPVSPVQTETLTPSTLFIRAVSGEYSMNLPAADALFAQFGGFAQAVDYADEAAVHRELIGLLRTAKSDPDPKSRSQALFSASAGFWQLGQRAYARRIMDLAIVADSQNTPAYVLAFDFALSQRDTIGASHYVSHAASIEPNYPLNVSLARVLTLFDSLRNTPGPEVRSGLHLGLAQIFDDLKMTDTEIENLLLSTAENPSNAEAWRFLAETYISRGRYSIAAIALHHVLSLNPGDSEAMDALLKIKPFL